MKTKNLFKNEMRKISAYFLSLVLALSLIGCGSESNANASAEPESSITNDAPEAEKGISNESSVTKGENGSTESQPDNTEVADAQTQKDGSQELDKWIEIPVMTDGTGVTVLVYIVGSDLETKGGAATRDIDEMMAAKFGEDVHVVIQTGGAAKWRKGSDNNTISNEKIQRYRVFSGRKVLLEEKELVSMGKPETLTDFLKWGVEKYPAEKYIAVLWDHGGGTLSGYGHDEIFNQTISTVQLAKAFKDADIHFDAIGFDACLMSTFEVAYSLKDYADYLVASEETEWGAGWEYKGWLNSWKADTSTLDICKAIVDSYSKSFAGTDDKYTLSVLKMEQIERTSRLVAAIYKEIGEEIDKGSFDQIAKARYNATYYGNGSAAAYAQVDLVDFLLKTKIYKEDSVRNAICGEEKGVVAYNKSNIDGSNGIAIFFPNEEWLTQYSYKKIARAIKQLGIDGEYFRFYDTYLGIKAHNLGVNFEPQGEYDTEQSSAEAEITQAVNSNPNPANDQNITALPIIKGKNGIYEVDTSKLSPEYLENVVDYSVETVMQIGGRNYLYQQTLHMKTLNSFGFDAEKEGKIRLEPCSDQILLNGEYATLIYFGKINDKKDMYISPMLVNGEMAFAFIEKGVTMVPNMSGEMVAGTASFSIRGYTSILDENGVPLLRGITDFQKGDVVDLAYLCMDDYKFYNFTGHEFTVEDNIRIALAKGYRSEYPALVKATLIDSFGGDLSVIAGYSSTNGVAPTKFEW